jgi:ketosteroid isomerase-like protein
MLLHLHGETIVDHAKTTVALTTTRRCGSCPLDSHLRASRLSAREPEDIAMNDGQAQTADEAAIRAVLDERSAAIRTRDARRFVRSLDPSIVTFDLAPPLRRSGPELLDPSGLQGWLDTWDGEIEHEMAELTISIGGHVAYCHGLEHVTGTRTDGKREDFWTRATVGLRKRDEGWKVTHKHASVPFHMDGTDRPAFDLRP